MDEQKWFKWLLFENGLTAVTGGYHQANTPEECRDKVAKWLDNEFPACPCGGENCYAPSLVVAVNERAFTRAEVDAHA